MTVLESAAGAARARIIAADMREERGIELLLGHVLERAACRLGGSRFLDRLLLGGLFGGLHVDLNLHEHAHEGLADLVEQLLEHVEGLALVFLLGLLLSIAAQVDALTKGLKRGNVLAPQLVENLKEKGAGKTREGLVTDHLLLLDVLGLGLLEKRLEQVVVRELVVRI